MTLVLHIWIGLMVVITLIWLTRHIELVRAASRLVTLRPADGRMPPEEAPKVSVLVAAKDEEANIGTCARTLLTQNYPDYELIIINDRSTDQTEAILRDIQKNDPNGSRLQVLNVQQLPPGWAGKNNAMRMGIDAAQGEWYLLSDADCRQTCETTISAAVNYVLNQRVDMLSVLPVLDTQTAWEKIIQPVAGAVMIFWFNPIRVNNPARRAAYANGAFILIRKDVYEKLGGHAAVRQQLNEDLHMAKLAKQNGFCLRVTQNEGLYLTRMYRNFGETWRGWSRIFYGCFGTVRQLAGQCGGSDDRFAAAVDQPGGWRDHGGGFVGDGWRGRCMAPARVYFRRGGSVAADGAGAALPVEQGGCAVRDQLAGRGGTVHRDADLGDLQDARADGYRVARQGVPPRPAGGQD